MLLASALVTKESSLSVLNYCHNLPPRTQAYTPTPVKQWLGVRGAKQCLISGQSVVLFHMAQIRRHRMLAGFPVLLPDRPVNWATRSEAILQAN